MKIHSSPIIMLSRAFRAWTSALAETDQRSEERRRGCWAIRICNQAQSKRVNLRGVCALTTKLAPCTALVEILRRWRSCTIEMLPRSWESERNCEGRVWWKRVVGMQGESVRGGPCTLCHLSLTAAYFRRWFPP